MNQKLLRTFIREVISDGFGNKNLGKDAPAGNLRYDVQVAARGTNILDDEAEEASKPRPRAACVLIIADDGKVLAVSRRNDPTAFGLPGGKVDQGEQPADAAARELKEETGLDVAGLRPVFVHKEDDGYETTTFIGSVSGKIDTKEEGVIRWVDREVLFNGPFGRYNRKLFATLGL